MAKPVGDDRQPRWWCRLASVLDILPHRGALLRGLLHEVERVDVLADRPEVWLRLRGPGGRSALVRHQRLPLGNRERWMARTPPLVEHARLPYGGLLVADHEAVMLHPDQEETTLSLLLDEDVARQPSIARSSGSPPPAISSVASTAAASTAVAAMTVVARAAATGTTDPDARLAMTLGSSTWSRS